MLLSFPHMGKLHLALARTCRLLDIPYLIPSLPGPKALKLGQELAPEGSCLPFCLVLGNMREALERGADTILMLGGCGPCRFGYFIYLAVKILDSAGYRFQPVIIDRGYHLYNYSLLKKAGHVSMPGLLRAIRHGWELLVAEEALDRLEREYLPLAKDPGSLLAFLEECREVIQEAGSSEEIAAVRKKAIRFLKQLPRRPGSQVVRIRLAGDIYTMLEPYANQGIEEFLLAKGVVVYKDLAVSHWFPNILLPWRKGGYREGLLRQAYPYLQSQVGGFGLESVAGALQLKTRLADGIIHLFPQGCMPEIVARSALDRISQDKGIPVLSIAMDQHDSKTGFETRVEAFLDMIGSRRVTRAGANH